MDNQEVEVKLKQYALENEQLKRIQNELQKENKILSDKLNATAMPKRVQKIEHSGDFWAEIRNKCKNKSGVTFIKNMIKEGKMTVYDENFAQQTLLIEAARNGAYDLTQFLINNVCLKYVFVRLYQDRILCHKSGS